MYDHNCHTFRLQKKTGGKRPRRNRASAKKTLASINEKTKARIRVKPFPREKRAG